jgi:ATP-binding cassette, subfamily F, member 3
MTHTEIRTVLGSFLFTSDEVFKEVNVLSGGEKVRLALAKLMLKGANLLILDEPTNHLDIPGKEALEKSLSDYEGTILFVSHDRYFVNKMAKGI